MANDNGEFTETPGASLPLSAEGKPIDRRAPEPESRKIYRLSAIVAFTVSTLIILSEIVYKIASKTGALKELGLSCGCEDTNLWGLTSSGIWFAVLALIGGVLWDGRVGNAGVRMLEAIASRFQKGEG